MNAPTVYPTNLFEAIGFPVTEFLGHCWQHITHPSVHQGILFAILLQVTVRRMLDHARSHKASACAPEPRPTRPKSRS